MTCTFYGSSGFLRESAAPVEGQDYTGAIATFSDTLGASASPAPDSSDYVTTVEWGDGNFVLAKLVSAGVPGRFPVSATSLMPNGRADARVASFAEFGGNGSVFFPQCPIGGVGRSYVKRRKCWWAKAMNSVSRNECPKFKQKWDISGTGDVSRHFVSKSASKRFIVLDDATGSVGREGDHFCGDVDSLPRREGKRMA